MYDGRRGRYRRGGLPTNSCDDTILPQPTTTIDPFLPTDVPTLHSMINNLKAELKASTSVNDHLAAYAASLQAELAIPTSTPATSRTTTPTTTPTTATAPATTTTPTSTTTASTAAAATAALNPCPPPNQVLNTPTGRGAASPEVFKHITKTNWHGRLGRTHMADVDALPTTALTELDCFLRRRLHAMFPRGGAYSQLDVDAIFMSLAAVGLRLEDRGGYADVPYVSDSTLLDAGTVQRAKNYALYHYAQNRKYDEYWGGFALETLVELARYRGLFDEEGFLRVE